MQGFCRVAIDSRVSALDRPFDYSIPERMLGRVAVGSVVRVVLHGRNMRAFVTELLDAPAVPKARALSSLVSQQPVFDEQTVALAAWVARRYVVPLGLVLHDNVPGRFSAPKGDSARSGAERSAPKPPWLVGDLAKVIDERKQACVLLPAADAERDLVAHAVGLARKRGLRSLVICPRVEVAENIAAVIAGSVVLHGEDRPADRAAAWAAARDGRADVVVGGRSALLVPLSDLGLVVVASAHDHSLKSERAPRVHGLVVAQRRAKLAGVAFVASSPAPPLEAVAGDGVVRLGAKRSVVKPQTARPRKGPVTRQMLETIASATDRGQNALVFVGRRGGALRLRCVDCAWTPTCPRCGSGLALVASEKKMRCRVCTATTGVPDECPACRGALSERGWGHDRVATAIERAGVEVPVVRVVRGVDADIASPSIVVGTLAAAHAIGKAGAIVVADLDQLLTRPDFRAAEYALQVLHELAGVLEDGGRFLVQTREPEHHVMQAFTRGSYRYFLDRELPFREETGYPPYGAVVRVELDESAVDDLRDELNGTGARMVGALANKGKMDALVRGPDIEPILDPLRRFTATHRAKIDVDPVDVG